uniref:RxLR effector protein n=1 Tax=Peronospora matthiolae TaxID=2874970 RepID=A0AAV1TWW0_9STRA
MAKCFLLLVLALVMLAGDNARLAHAISPMSQVTSSEQRPAGESGLEDKQVPQSRGYTKTVASEERGPAKVFPLPGGLIVRRPNDGWVAAMKNAAAEMKNVLSKTKYFASALKLEGTIAKFKGMQRRKTSVDDYGKELQLDPAAMDSYRSFRVSAEDLRRRGREYGSYLDYKYFMERGPEQMRLRLRNEHAPEPTR